MSIQQGETEIEGHNTGHPTEETKGYKYKSKLSKLNKTQRKQKQHQSGGRRWWWISGAGKED